MNLRDFQYLIAVAEHLHFGRAAEACFVSQPTLSGQIKKLEQELGVDIFERTNKQVSVTPIGEQILDHARRALEQAAMIRQLSQAHQDPMAGPFRLGIIPTLGPYLAPLLLSPIRRDYPQMRLILSEEITEQLTEHLLNHKLDAALMATEPDDERLESIPLFHEPFWLALHRDDPVYHQDTINAKTLSGLKILLLADGHCLAEQVQQVCGQSINQSDSLANDLKAASLETLIQLVAAKYGATLVPALAMRGGWLTDTGVVTRPLDISGAYRCVRLVYRHSYTRPKAIQCLCDLIKRDLPNTVTAVDAPS